MKTTKASTKPMVQGRSTGNDIKKLVFSHNGLMYISVDRNFHVILWDTTNQSIIKEFGDVLGHYGSFSADDKRLFIIGRQKLHIFKLQKLQQSKSTKPKTNGTQNPQSSLQLAPYSIQEIKRFQNGFFMGTVQCSPNNLYFAYSNSSELYVRDMLHYQRIFHVPYLKNTGIAKQTVSNGAKTPANQIEEFSKLCSPFFVKFNDRNGDLYTASLNDGEICKWGFSQIENITQSQNKQGNELSQEQKNNMSNFPIYLKKKSILETIVSDIDFANNFLIISSDRNRRKIFILNEETLLIQKTRTLPKAFFLDFNTEIQSTYSYKNDVIISVAVPGDFLFFHNGTSLGYLSSSQTKMNIYTLEYQNFRNILALGGQVENQQDQIVFYNLESSINQEQECLKGEFWHTSSQACKKLPCKEQEISQLNKNRCKCSSKFQIWNPVLQKCTLFCGTIENSLSFGFFPSINKEKLNYCPCMEGYRWNFESKKCQSFECRKVQGSTGRLNFPFSINQCQCYDNFRYQKHQKRCVLNCSKVNFSQGQSFFVEQNNSMTRIMFEPRTFQACNCLEGYSWNQNTYSCLLKQKQSINSPIFHPKNPQNQSKDQNQANTNTQFYPQKPQVSQQSIPAVAIILPILLVLLLIIFISIGILYWKRPNFLFRKKQEQDDQKISQLYSHKKSCNQDIDKNKETQNKVQAQKKSQEISELDENEFQVSLQRNENKNEGPDFINTAKRRRRKLHKVDSEKTAKNINFGENQGLETDRPMNIVPKTKIKSQQQSQNKKSPLKKNQPLQKVVLAKNPDKYTKPQLPSKSFESKFDSIRTYPCQICFEEESDGFTKCKHYFHVKCMNEQFQKYGKNEKMECPSCWQPLLNGMDDFYFFSKQSAKQKHNTSKISQSGDISFQQQKEIQK